MIPHTLKIGERIYDTHDERFGVVLLVNNMDNGDFLISQEDTIICYKPDDSDGECETMAKDCYPVVEGKTFFGHEVCYEILADEMEEDYDYYCPENQENCYESELD